MSSGVTILIVDDEQNTREGLQRFLDNLNYDALSAKNAKDALRMVLSEHPDIVLTDLRMPEMDGLELLHAIHRKRPETIVIVFTAYGTVENAVQAMKAGAFYYLTKPLNLDELELTLKKALHQRTLESENKALREELLRVSHDSDTILTQSDDMKQLIASAKKVAKSDSTVLLQGESGTGKELFAHLIHSESERAKKPFVTVHMAALTETLLASELFGHERGAFTGATERKIGRFERAHSGTLFLDEVSEIPELMQTKLLRVIQTGEFERVGGSKTIHADVRLICATNKKLEQEVQKGRFREDLFYRINVILFDIPPLRTRPNDVPLLASHYLDYFAKKNRKRVGGFTTHAVKLLCEYHWPGNVRELKNVIERIVVLSSDDTVDVDQIPGDLRAKSRNGSESNENGPKSTGTIQNMEKEMIRRALAGTNQNKSLAAKKLGISRRTLYRKIDEYGIQDGD
jgi:two-component system, NtrC family, response regulator AtoC